MNKEMEKKVDDRTYFGFWVYLMTDLLMFAILFASFAVLRNSTHGGITIHQIVNPPFVLMETVILLTSSFTVGLATLMLYRNKKAAGICLLLVTVVLGLAFLGMELFEFNELLVEGNGPQQSAFLSSFFALVGTHGLHIASGTFWIIIMIIQISRKGITHPNLRKTILASTFWHFLDIVWIFIFTIVYLLGGII